MYTSQLDSSFSPRVLLGGALLKEVLHDDWRMTLDPETARVLLDTAVLPGKSYRRGEALFASRLNGAFMNRHIDTVRVRTYAKKMVTRDIDGTLEWKDRITEIGVTPEGVLAMGFHTCLAVILSGTSHEVRLLTNFTEAECNSEGTGRQRDFADVLFTYGIPDARSTAAVITMIANHRRTRSPLNSLTSGGVRNTNAELLAIMDSVEMPLITESVRVARRLAKLFYSVNGKYRKRSAIAPPTVAHLYVEWMSAYPAKAPAFFEGLESGVNISGPVLLLRERFRSIAAGTGTPLDGVLNPYVRTSSLMGLAWKHHVQGSDPGKLQLSNPPAPLICEVHHP